VIADYWKNCGYAKLNITHLIKPAPGSPGAGYRVFIQERIF
jgi:hypothetical protein